MSETDSVSSKSGKHDKAYYKAQRDKYKSYVEQLTEIIAQKDEEIKALNEKLAEKETPAEPLKCLKQNGDGNEVIILDISNDIPKEIPFTKGIELHRNDEKSFARLLRTKINVKGYPILLKKGNFPDCLNFEILANDICEANYVKKKYLKQKNRFYLADDVFDDFKTRLINAINSIPI